MTISAQMIRDSVSETGIRICSLQLRYPRFIHSEFMTHRDFSRNAGSSRAIPIKTMVAAIRKDPAMPIHWGANQKGMQAENELFGWRLAAVKFIWLMGMWIMTTLALWACRCGVHKQIANRMIEPWAHIVVLVTSTKWENFFALRRHKDAQPEIKALADAIYEQMQQSKPVLLRKGQWHLPYFENSDWDKVYAYLRAGHHPDYVPPILAAQGIAIKVSVARCARTSYVTFDQKRSEIPDDITLYARLLGAQPLHASPAEHQATPDELQTIEIEKHLDQEGSTEHMGVAEVWANPSLQGNLHGWIQYRKTLPGEYVSA